MSNCSIQVKPKRFYAVSGFSNHSSKARSLLRAFKRHDDVFHLQHTYDLIDQLYPRNSEDRLPSIFRDFLTEVITLLASSHSNNVKLTKAQIKNQFLEFFSKAWSDITEYEVIATAKEEIDPSYIRIPGDARITVSMFEADPSDGSKYDLMHFSLLFDKEYRKVQSWNGKTAKLNWELLYPGFKFSDELNEFVKGACPGIYPVNTDSFFHRDYVKLDTPLDYSYPEIKRKNFSNNGNITPIIFDTKKRISFNNSHPLKLLMERFTVIPQLNPKTLTTLFVDKTILIRDGRYFLLSNNYLHLLYLSVVFLDYLKNDYSPKFAWYWFIQRLFSI